MSFRPMLAIDFKEWALRFPYHATPKLDGIRCLVLNGEARTRSLKWFPNHHVHDWFRANRVHLDNLDGELIVGDPRATDCYRQTASALMSEAGRPAFLFLVFDYVDTTGRLPFSERAAMAQAQLSDFKPDIVGWLGSDLVHDLAGLQAYEQAVTGQGYEGVMLRRPDSRYKQGRATLNEASFLKVKRFRDAEAIVVGIEEQMHNTNEAFRSELGRTKRSLAKAGLVGKGTAGALTVMGAPGQPFAGVAFSIGTGMDDELRAALWKERARIVKSRLMVRYRYLEVGVKDAPRHPVFVGFRQEGS